MEIHYTNSLETVNWQTLKSTLNKDAFDNGRSPEQLQKSFQNSFSVCLAYDEEQIVGTARVLSDDVCNAYIVDVWTLSTYRKQGIATAMINNLLEKLNGQHVYLFTNDSVDFYKKLGFVERPTGLELVVGNWLIK